MATYHTLTKVSKDKHPQKKLTAAYIPLQKAAFEMLAYTSLTALAPSTWEIWFLTLAPLHDFQPFRFLLSCKLDITSSLSSCNAQTVCVPHCARWGFTALIATISQKKNCLSLKLWVCPPPQKKCYCTNTVSGCMIHSSQCKRFHNHLTSVLSSPYPIH